MNDSYCYFAIYELFIQNYLYLNYRMFTIWKNLENLFLEISWNFFTFKNQKFLWNFIGARGNFWNFTFKF